MTSFSELGLAEPIVRALTEEKHVTPTPIQAQAIPAILSGKDLIGIAQTGTGKTAAFGLPILDHLSRNPRRIEPRSCRVLILSPTRELSGQILDNLDKFGRHIRLSTTLAIGGVPMGRQIRALQRGVDVLVATPGRLMDLVENNALKLDTVEVFVLDEADQMLDMGFVHAIKAIVRRLPHKRHSLFFSATMPSAIADLAASMLRNPVTVAVTPVAKTADRVDQRVIFVEKPAKAKMLAEVLSTEEVDRALVFTRTKHGADKVVQVLARAGHKAEAIHGNKSQNQRDRVLAAFREGSLRTLVATDIAARGIDVTGVSHVINYDLPNVPESYVHRIGRTARAGREGIAISFCDGEERAYLRSIEKLIRMTLPTTDRRGEARPAEAADAVGEDRPRANAQPRGERQERREPRGERKEARPPRAERPQGERVQGDRPRGERPRGERTGAERNGAERNGAERHGAERVHSERPAGARQRSAAGPHGEGRKADARPAHGGRAEQPRSERGGRAQGGQRAQSSEIGAIGFMRAPARSDKTGPARRPVR
ncbi:helicase [Azorhizobium caulinodans ORS 571]|uniref:Helicase n=1 Tax=Azorhizobium caulinodans (strain ATCC 43989 / DSM 5975 / JCM 20966 / LMG 6465 / NBRC 14845 / NCIMB 13405 / ORS 571) TaxID=438753 RepID=A8I658_AZOC5|nr:DEAD/DEAH box helicase [Azorhizobium caulinodans]BAF88364.1 helicase [Azorhizobium caulinodans ORS 571]